MIDSTEKLLPHHLEVAIKNIYQPAGLTVTDAFPELESAEYGACRFELNGKNIVYRVAKITPIKVGQFVTIWKRPEAITMPFDSNDPIDFVVIDVSHEDHAGQFIFDRKILIEKGIMSHQSKKGKMGIRVYPPWSKPVVKQAIKTQQWQLQYFFPFGPKQNIYEFFKR